MNVSSSLQSGLIGLNRNYDNTVRSPSVSEAAKVDEPEGVSAKTSESQQSLQETSQGKQAQSAAEIESTRVVTEAGKLSPARQMPGSLIDVHA